jgi:iron-sulfur cluster assembly accessory protein
MNVNITFTDAARLYIKKMLEKKGGVGFRLSIKKTGCSGYSYSPTIVEKINAEDLTLKLTNDLTIFIDVTWLSLLQGLHVDYMEEEKSGLKQKRLIFTNSNEASRCGCGESFHIE